MKSLLFTFFALAIITNTSTAQVMAIDHNENATSDYYFIVRASNGSQAYPTKEAMQRKDILDKFISDSITFHIRNKSAHRQHPHVCQNRFHRFGLIGTQNTVQIPFDFDYIMHTIDTQFFVVEKNERYGLIDSRGKTILPFKYEYCNQLQGILAMKKNSTDPLLIFYSVKGKYLFSANGYFAEEKKYGYISINDKKDFQKSIIDRKGKPVSVPANTYIAWILDDYICCYKDQHYGVITLTSKRVIPFEYTNITATGNDQFIVNKNGMSGVIDANNHFIIPADSMTIGSFGRCYILRKSNSDKMSLVGLKGEEILPAEFHIYGEGINYDNETFKKTDDQSILFVENKITKLKGVYSSEGKLLIPVNNIALNYQKSKHAVLFTKKSGNDLTGPIVTGAIDIRGKILANPSSDELSFIDTSPNIILLVDSNNTKSALINIATGDRISFDGYNFRNYQMQLDNGYLAAGRDFKYALVSPDGKRLTDAIYGALFPVTEKERKLFDQEIVCWSKTREGLVGITKSGKEIPAKNN